MNAKIAALLGISSLATCTLMSAPPVVVIQPPSVVVQVPVPVPAPPPVAVEVAVPDSYAWDGYEYVGVVGDQYYYLGPDHVWLTLDAPRLGRFHDWEKGHSDWRTHAIHNDLYRHDAHGHDAPVRDMHAPAPSNDHGHDAGDHHDTDHHDHDGH